MASIRRKKKSKKFSFRKLLKSGKAKLIGFATAVGLITAGGVWGYNQGIDIVDKGIEYDTDDLDNDLVINPIEEEPVIEEPTIEDNDVVDESLEVEEEPILDEIEEEQEVTEEVEEEKQEDTESESLEISKDKETTITSYSLDDLVIPVVKNFEDVSIVNVLNEIGYDYSISSRARLAVYFNIVSSEEEFIGLDYQNTQLLAALRQYANELQNSAYNDYANAVTDNTISNSTSDNTYTYVESSDNSYNYEEVKEDKKEDKDKDHEEDHDKDDENKHVHQASDPNVWESDETGHWHICIEDGEKFDITAHTYGEWIDTVDGRRVQACSVCGYEKECTHDLGDPQWECVDEKTHKHICPTCGKEEIFEHRGDFGEITIDPENAAGFIRTKTCPDCNYEITLHYNQKASFSYDSNNTEFCYYNEYKCTEDPSEIYTENIKHNFELDHETDTIKCYICSDCGLIKEESLSNTNNGDKPLEEQEEVTLENQEQVTGEIINQGEVQEQDQVSEEGMVSQDEQIQEELVINFEFNLQLDKYEFMDEEEPDVDFQPPEVKESTDLIVTDEEQEEQEEQKEEELKEEIKQIEQKEVLQLEEKKDSSQDANKDNTTNIIASFDKELYKELFKGKVALEQSLATLKGIEREEKLQLLNDINAVRKNMVQDLANALVQEELNKVEKGQSQGLVFKM